MTADSYTSTSLPPANAHARSLKRRRATLSPIVIPMIDLPAQYAQVKDAIDTAVVRVLSSGRYVLGPEVDAFEKEFAQVCAVRHAVGVNSGTSALYLSLRAAGVGLGDEVITVPFTFEATVAAIQSVGALVRFVDIDPRSLTMDPTGIEAQITDLTKALIPVHLFGQPADMDPILDVARRHGLVVIEDACQAHGALYKDQPVGSFGDLACFSFYPSKNLSTVGEGGIIVTNNEALAETARQLRSWGPIAGAGNFRLSAIEAAVLRVKLPRLGEWTTKRQTVASLYGELLTDSGLEPPTTMPYAAHVFNVYAVRSTQRDRIAAALRAGGIASAVHYPQPVHLQDRYKDLGYSTGVFPVAEAIATKELSLPIYPELSEVSVRTIVKIIRQALPSD